ncbi:unnamed protein product [Candidula unifasciata]|uniref:Mothers against decapentaplegic homolog n=1 Tax=Candidula unifasciata TaxID=100452 RepID=A0A8S3YI40_9EUPU|nr:unnamed protein product [Candidula unifasciata]
MFRSKRSSLVKRLWKYRVNDETKSSSQRDTSTAPLQPDSTTSFHEDIEFKSVTNSFLKRLKEDQLEALVQAMESRGGEVTPCVPVAKSFLRIGRLMVSPYVLCCRVFRWPDLKSDADMKRLPSCMRQNEDKEAVICCNPYHWSLVVKIDEPPVHPQRNELGDKHEDGYPKILEPTDTGHSLCGHQEDLSGYGTEYDCRLWCTVAYWELKERVGRLFTVTDPSVHIFQQLPHGDGMCLRLFQKPTNVEVVKRTREKIGFGIILSREAAHKRDASMVATHDAVEDSAGLSPETSVSPLSSQLCLSSSPFLSPPQEERGDAECGLKSHSVFSSTSNCQMPALPSGVHGTDVDLVRGVVSDIIADCDEKDVSGHHYGDSTEQPSCHQHGHQQHGTYDSMHDSYLYTESMDYTQDLGTSPPYFQQSNHLGIHPQSRSPSCLSSSSFSSSPPSSPPLYFSSDTSFYDLHYSSVNYGGSVDTSDTTHINNNKANNNNNHHHHHSNISGCIKRFNTGSSTDNSKSGRNLTSPILAPSTVTQTTNVTSSTVQSSGLPANQGEVWAYNASDFPIFVNSPTLDDPQFPRSLVVKKVPPGYSIKVYDYARAELLERTDARSVLLKDGPFDPCCVRISLAKGWGPSYSRQFITSCPCWLEVLLGARKHSSAS